MRTFAWGVVAGLLLGPAIAVTAAFAGWIPVAATSEPPAWELAVARRALASSVAREAVPVPNPIAPSTDNLRAGMHLYRDNCAGCHGDAGKPSAWGSRDFYPRVPQFASEPPSRPDWQLFWIVAHGVRYSGMGAWGELMPLEDRWKVVTFLSHLRGLPPELEAEWRRR